MPGRFRVEITRLAEADIDAIYEYIRREDELTAMRFIKKLEDQIATLESFPLRCPVIPESSELTREYRHLLYGEYRTIFRIEGRKVYICRVIHGARLLDLGLLERT